MTDEQAAISLILEYGLSTETDIYAYIGNIDRTGYENVCNVLCANLKKNCLIVLCTFGGDPNAGYRIARAFSHNYPHGKISVLVPDFCKSAGTLICIGAHELIIADKGELGPLDIQVQKPDEMFQRSSGLDIIRGLTYLYDGVLGTFRDYLVDINSGSGLSTKAASEIASKLTIGIHEPIFAQIDPLRLGEMQAALTIALDYGKRLNERTTNLKQDALQKLTSGYPSHGFVIDRKEARQLFNNVRCPNEVENILSRWAGGLFSTQQASLVLNCISFFSEQLNITQAPSIVQFTEESNEINDENNTIGNSETGIHSDNSEATNNPSGNGENT
jgi:Serine dehydrogenase proteinase